MFKRGHRRRGPPSTRTCFPLLMLLGVTVMINRAARIPIPICLARPRRNNMQLPLSPPGESKRDNSANGPASWRECRATSTRPPQQRLIRIPTGNGGYCELLVSVLSNSSNLPPP
mmetsp:Transcript_17390/g.34729  ORF Transcript_17390/g.34729 Transcript_17390/m.34729 type:complete len:115 (-) Transcript_17390:2580-2924(-)